MKRIVIFMFIIISFLAACSFGNENETGDAEIKEADLTHFEQSLMNVMNEQAFIYEIAIHNDDVGELKMTVDYYENGEFITQITEFDSSLSGDTQKDTIHAVFAHQAVNEEQEEWTLASIDDGGSSSSKAKNEMEDREEMNASMWGGITNPTTLSMDEKRVVAYIVNSNQNAMSSGGNLETEEELKRIMSYEQAYILSVELK